MSYSNFDKIRFISEDAENRLITSQSLSSFRRELDEIDNHSIVSDFTAVSEVPKHSKFLL